MINWIKLWNWAKVHVVLLGIFLGILTFLSTMAYLQGRTDGADACEARFEKEKVSGYAAVVNELAEMNRLDAEKQKLWDKQNQAVNQALERKIENTYRVVEKIVEKPIEVQGDCSISYDVIGVLNDAAGAPGN